MTTETRTIDLDALATAIQRLEVEAYQHGLRNGRPNGKYRAGHFKPDHGIPQPVGKPHHAARAEVDRILRHIAGTRP